MSRTARLGKLPNPPQHGHEIDGFYFDKSRNTVTVRFRHIVRFNGSIEEGFDDAIEFAICPDSVAELRKLARDIKRARSDLPDPGEKTCRGFYEPGGTFSD